jgi:hypothetical protein
MLAIVEAQQHAQRVYVGDSQQAIYGFTGAVNALDRIREPTGGETAYLTQSFRFGPAVAEVANVCLAIETPTLRSWGYDSIPSVVGPAADPDAILTRTNATAVRTVIARSGGGKIAPRRRRPRVVAFARAARDLMDERLDVAPRARLLRLLGRGPGPTSQQDEQGATSGCWSSWSTTSASRRSLLPLGRMTREDEADVIVSTAHKAKGREWGSVQLGGDFPTASKMHTDELRLLYVAVTRAKRELDIDAVDREIFNPKAQETVAEEVTA